MAAAPDFSLQRQLLDRRQRLQAAASAGHAQEAVTLLHEVDAALQRMERGVYGLCEVCNDPVEPDRLMADPTTRFCLDHMTPSEQKAFEEDLSVAARIQRELLPKPGWRTNAWDDALVLYTDGALETEDETGEDFGLERLSTLLAQHAAEDCRTLLSSCLEHVTAFGKSADDLTLLAIRRLD